MCDFLPFNSIQANQLAELIAKRYQDKPLFLLKDNDYGVFRHDANHKWYAIIMNIDRFKLDGVKAPYDIINVKVPVFVLNDLRKEKGIYPAYHMNKKHWVSIVLDNALSDDRIMELVENSYKLTI